MRDSRLILVVDDSVDTRRSLAAMLVRAGYDVECVDSGEAAIQRLAGDAPDLLIVDQELPGMQGEELCRRMRLNAATRSLPVLMLTESVDEKTESIALRSGVDEYVCRSEGPDMVLLRIRVLLRRPRLQDTRIVALGRFRKPRLLLVDDEDSWLSFMAEKLGSAGYDTEVATRGAVAWEIFEAEAFDGILVDLHLPDLSATELVRRVADSQSGAGSQCIIIALAGDSSSDDRVRLLDAGADDVMPKSRDVSIVRARLEALLRRKFLYEENYRLQNEFREQERRVLRAEAEREAAVAKAELAEKLAAKNRQLERAYAELKEAESQLVHQAKMASLGQLVAGIAHEINNPLGFVMSHVETVRKAIESVAASESLSNAGQAKLEKARHRSRDLAAGLERIRELVVKLRTFSRLDEGDIKTVDVHEALDATLTLLGHRLRSGIRVSRGYEATPLLECQPGPLNQVWMNLLSNAIDAIGEQGALTIRTRDAEDALLVQVEDTGAGMSSDVLERIFEPFFTTKEQGQGTGLGLSISYGVVKSHAGTLSVESEPGKGSRFTVRLPRRLRCDL